MYGKIKKLQFMSEAKISPKHSWFYIVIIVLEWPTFQNMYENFKWTTDTKSPPNLYIHLPYRVDGSKK